MSKLLTSALTLEAFTPRRVMKLSFALLQQSAETIRLFAPWPEMRLASQEFQNKLEAFRLFEHVDSFLQISTLDQTRLAELNQLTRTLEPFRAVWATEGLGYYLTETTWNERGTPRNLLSDEGGGPPERALVPLHAGMGLALANRLLRAISLENQPCEIRRVLEQFAALCRDNSRTGYTAVAYESLGLVARNLYPYLIPTIDRELAESQPDLQDYFWHGVGRAIYFSPTNALPDCGSSGRALRMVREEPPHDSGKRNALAGLAWAMTLVNIRHPEILGSFLKRHGDQVLDNDAFANGVGSSVVIWQDATDQDSSLTAFYRFEPDPSNVDVVTRWERIVRRSFRDALDQYDGLKKHRRLGEVFRYGDLATLAQQS